MKLELFKQKLSLSIECIGLPQKISLEESLSALKESKRRMKGIVTNAGLAQPLAEGMRKQRTCNMKLLQLEKQCGIEEWTWSQCTWTVIGLSELRFLHL